MFQCLGRPLRTRDPAPLARPTSGRAASARRRALVALAERALALRGPEALLTLLGGGGADSLVGGAGNDSLFGDSSDPSAPTFGDDLLKGQGGDDTIIDGTGADVLDGGRGNDLLSVFADAAALQTPAVLISDVTIPSEGDSGAVNAVFTVSLSSQAMTTVTVDFATASGTAFAEIGRAHV